MLARPLTSNDIESVFVGLRSLIASSLAETTNMSREHAVAHPSPGLVVVSGGKYTTYRVIAKNAVDANLAHAGLYAPASRTATIPP